MSDLEKADADWIRGSELFDADWYRLHYPDVGLLGMDPVEHYLRIGGLLKRDPSPRFDVSIYLADNPDVGSTGINPLLHYLKWGNREERGGALKSNEVVPREPLIEVGNGVDWAADKATDRAPIEHSTMPHVHSRGKPWPAQFQPVVRSAEIPVELVEQYEVIEPEFDVAYYLRRYRDLASAAGLDPILHYIKHGANEGRDPSPDFSTKYYLKRYPDVELSGVNPFYHYLTMGRTEGRPGSPFSSGAPNFDSLCRVIGRAPTLVAKDLAARRRDLRARFEHGVLGEMVAKAAELEPLIHQSWEGAISARMPPFHSPQLVTETLAIHALHEAAGFRQATGVVVIPHCRLGGATRIAGHLAVALAETYGPEQVVVVRTDATDMQYPGWFPEGCRHIDLAAATKDLSGLERQKLLAEFLRSLRPAVVFNVNSRLLWDAMRLYGLALSSSMAVYAYMFCADKDVYGHWVGYPIKELYRHFDVYAGIITDSHFLQNEIYQRCRIPPGQAHKLATFETPVSQSPPVAPAPAPLKGRRAQVFWAGRFDRQKRVDVVLDLASRMEEVDFHLWGEPVLDKVLEREKMPDNVFLEGVYTAFSDLPLERCDLWLYTSEWDGVPNILIEVAAAGVPLVGSLTGGTGEVLIEGLSHRIADVEDIAAWKTAISTCLADPVAARERAMRLRQRILARRTPAAYREAVKKLVPVRETK